MKSDEFMKDFVNNYLGKAIDFDAVHGVQCVDGAKIGMYILGISNPPTTGDGNASGYWKHFTTNGMSKYFDKIPHIQDVIIGDMLIFSTPAPTGHVGWAYKNNQVFGENQDGRNDGFTLRPTSNWTFLGALRFKGFNGISQPFHGWDGENLNYEYQVTDAENFADTIKTDVFKAQSKKPIRRNGSHHIYFMDE